MLLLLLFIILIIVAGCCIKIVPQARCYVIEFLGKYKVSWDAGIHFLIPFFERIAKKVSLKEQVADFPPQPVITKDNVTMKIDTVVYFKIFDPKLYVYGVENPIMALENLTATTLRNLVGDLELDETLTSRDTINTKMQTILDEATDAWGIKVNRVELKNIIPPAEIQNAMEKQMKAEREKRQTLLEAEAHKLSVVSRAEGDKEAKILAAEAERDAEIAKATGQAEAIRLVYEAEAKGIQLLNESNPEEKVLSLKKIDALKALGDGRATKIILPTDLTGMASTLTVAAEMLGTQGAEKIDKSEKEVSVEKKADVCCTNEERSKETLRMAAFERAKKHLSNNEYE